MGRQLELETGEERELFEKPPKLLTDWILKNSSGRKTEDREYNQGLGKVQQTLEGGYLERRLCPFQPKSEQMMMKRIKMKYVAMSRWSLELEKIMRGLPEYLI